MYFNAFALFKVVISQYCLCSVAQALKVYIYRSQMKSREGNVFIGDCLSTGEWILTLLPRSGYKHPHPRLPPRG